MNNDKLLYNVSNVKQTLILDTRAYFFHIFYEKYSSVYLDSHRKFISELIISCINVLQVEVWLRANRKVK